MDVSNSNNFRSKLSNTERLAAILPNCRVLKAFNTVPALAFDLKSRVDRSRVKVYVAGDSRSSRCVVINMATSLGFPAVDFGGMRTTGYLEKMTSQVFPGWRFPLALTCAVLVVVGVYIYWQNYVHSHSRSYEQVLLLVLNKVVCVTAVTVLSLTYLPGESMSHENAT